MKIRLWRKVQVSEPKLARDGYRYIVDYIREGERIPSWYGIAWWAHEPDRNVQYAVIMPIPLNLIVSPLHWLYARILRFVKVPPWRFEQRVAYTMRDLKATRRDMEKTAASLRMLASRFNRSLSSLEIDIRDLVDATLNEYVDVLDRLEALAGRLESED